MTFTRVEDDIYVVLHGVDAPSTEEWDTFIADANGDGSAYTPLRMLVYTDGGAPTVVHRSQLTDLSERRAMNIAVLGEPRAVKQMVQVFAWSEKIRAAGFGGTDLPGAMRHLGLPLERSESYGDTIRQLQAKLMLGG